MTITISKNFLNNLLKLREKDWNEKVKETEVFEKLREVLIYDGILKNTSKVEFEKIGEQFQGIYIKKLNKVIYFTQMLTAKGKLRSRNTFINQNFETVRKFAAKSKATISISINPFDLNKTIAIPESVKMDFKTLLTFDSTLQINKSISFVKTQNYKKLDEFVGNHNKIRSKNKGNNSTYIKLSKDDKIIVLYGKLNGANFKDTLNIAKTLKTLNSEKYTLEFVEISNIGDSKELKQLTDLGFYIINIDEKSIKDELLKSKGSYETILRRNQLIFIRNILKKYENVKGFDLSKCFACDYNVESNLIAAHIHRVTDIIRDYNSGSINNDEAYHLLVSGENGFLLCPNHDKEFEKGIIIFDFKTKQFIANTQSTIYDNFLDIYGKLNTQKFKHIEYTKEFENNIKLHIKRVTE